MLTHFELAVLNKLLEGGDPVLEVLRAQSKEIDVARREFTGVGFYTWFVVSPDAPLIPSLKSFTFGDVVAQIEKLQYGAGFLLHVERGVMQFLEAYCYEESWPSEIGTFSLEYLGGKRSLEILRKAWSG